MPQKVESLRLLEKFQQRVGKCHIMKEFFGLYVGGLILLNTYQSTTGSNLSACECYQQRRDGVKVDCDKALQQIKDLENSRDTVKIDWVDKISWLALKRKKVFNSILVNSG